MSEDRTPKLARKPSFLQIFPEPMVPVRATGAIVTDTAGTHIATCPNAAMADFVAWSINTHNGVHD